MPSPPDVGVVVVAAGRGERAGAGPPKQFRDVAGVPILLRSLRPFLAHPEVARVVVAVPEEFADRPPEWLGALVGDRLTVVAGGVDRMASVERGIAALGDRPPVVVVHDGARPFVAPAVIDAVIAEARRGRGAVAAVPVSDTLKEARPGTNGAPSRVARTVPRAGLWRAQTPQAFPSVVLRRALARARAAGMIVTDDASAVEAIDVPVVLIADLTTNLKITSPADFALAEAIARAES
jgi:2-C-methyl-D-erythritol 4-phosphate cytidylyltransferase